MVGSLSPRKRPALAVAVARNLVYLRGDTFEMHFVGSGPEEGVVSDASVKLPVRLVGELTRDDLRHLMRRAEVLLHTSAEDGWGMVVAEAAGEGLLIVATPWTDSALELAQVVPTVRVVRDDPVAMAATIHEQMDSSMTEDDRMRASTAVHDAVGPATVSAVLVTTIRQWLEHSDG